jgi:general stress protein YciG
MAVGRLETPAAFQEQIMADERKQGRGNFAQDRERAAEAGRKGGQASNRGGTNKGNFANDRERAREAGRKGGQR